MAHQPRTRTLANRRTANVRRPANKRTNVPREQGKTNVSTQPTIANNRRRMDFTPIPYKDVTAAYQAFSNRLKTGVLVPKRKLTWRPSNRIMPVYWHEQ